jgi:hypothetical protein
MTAIGVGVSPCTISVSVCQLAPVHRVPTAPHKYMCKGRQSGAAHIFRP